MTTDCDDDKRQREMPELGGSGAQTADPDHALLVRAPSDKFPLTARHEVDVHSAITSGLAAYLLTLEGAIAGRDVSLAHVAFDWADHDEAGIPSPSAAVHSEEIGKYDNESGMGPSQPIQIDDADPARVLALQVTSFYMLEELTVDVMCEDKIQRQGVRRMLEDAFSPLSWMVGFRLVLPRYHNAIATYYCLSAQTPDAPDVAAASVRPLTMRLKASCPVYRVDTFPRAKPRAIESPILAAKPPRP